MTKHSRSRLENVTKCFYYHLLWLSSKGVTLSASLCAAEYRAGFGQSGFSWNPCWLSWVFADPCSCHFAGVLCLRGAKVLQVATRHTRVRNDPVFLGLFLQWLGSRRRTKVGSGGAPGLPHKTRQGPWSLAPLHWCSAEGGRLGSFPSITNLTHCVTPAKLLSPSHLSSRGTTPQKPINPFQTQVVLHMWFLVAWFLARGATVILLLGLRVCLLFIMRKLDGLPRAAEGGNNDCHIVSSTHRAKEAVWTFPWRRFLWWCLSFGFLPCWNLLSLMHILTCLFPVYFCSPVPNEMILQGRRRSS